MENQGYLAITTARNTDLKNVVGNCTYFAESAFHYMTDYIPLVCLSNEIMKPGIKIITIYSHPEI